MTDATARIERLLAAQRIDRANETAPAKWQPAFDLQLVRAFFAGGGLDAEIEATGYAATTCLARVSRLLPATITHSARAALLDELQARCEGAADG